MNSQKPVIDRRRFRFKLRTLLIVMTVACLLLALMGRMTAECGTTIGGGAHAVICRADVLRGVSLSSDGKLVQANFGRQIVFVDAGHVEVVGNRVVQLPASWKKLELVRSPFEVQIVLDGEPLK
jgi:hypothetical protein